MSYRPLSMALIAVVSIACGSGASGVDATTPPGDGSTANIDASPTSDSAPGGDAAQSTDFGATGPFAVATSSGSELINGCTLAYDLYTPTGGANAPLVMLGHGFQRNRTNVAEIAEHIASFGMRVAAPSYCHSTFLDADHTQNGTDAAALTTRLANGAPVVQMGHSAGGASAFVAAAGTIGLAGVMGLDAVDSDGIATNVAPTLSVPVFGLVGESGSCNSNNNGLPFYTGAPMGFAARVVGATHCDFEAPTGTMCTLVCSGTDADRAALVRALAAAFAAWRTGVDPSGASWVQAGGARFQALVAESRLIEL